MDSGLPGVRAFFPGQAPASSDGGAAGTEVPPARALAIYAHPDDPDISCGGTLAIWAGAGSEVHVCICCDGDKGSLDRNVAPAQLAALRRKEVQSAGKRLGVAAHHWLGYPDGDVEGRGDLRERIVALVRQVQPEVVLAPDPTSVFFGQSYVNHQDHRAVGWAVLDAVAPAAAYPHYFPNAGPSFQVRALYLSGTLEPDTWVDITETIEVKASALACHTSQLGEGGEWLLTAVRQQAEEAGQVAGRRYAEAFRRVVLG
ncbi:MAG TPA: PIG-L deacetylase family protein [Acidimicrobiales bacterium]|nr:PIG-L deacetylase family protein [Acidimicrobiales bacterium]